MFRLYSAFLPLSDTSFRKTLTYFVLLLLLLDLNILQMYNSYAFELSECFGKRQNHSSRSMHLLISIR